MRLILESSDHASAMEQKRKCIDKFEKSALEFVKWPEENIEEGLTGLSFPLQHQKKIRTDNGIEKLNKEILKRTKVVMIFPNLASCEKLLTAVLQDVHEEWTTGRRYLDMSVLETVPKP